MTDWKCEAHDCPAVLTHAGTIYCTFCAKDRLSALAAENERLQLEAAAYRASITEMVEQARKDGEQIGRLTVQCEAEREAAFRAGAAARSSCTNPNCRSCSALYSAWRQQRKEGSK